MISQLSITNFAIIEQLDISLKEGFFAITGETGAGKSILFQAISLCLGGRAKTEMIRQGQDKAMIELQLDVNEEQLERIRPILEENDCDVDECIQIKRIIGIKGNRIYINGTRSNSSVLQAIAKGLVDIIGQHASHELLSVDSHIQILDRYAGLEKEVRRFQKKVENYNALLREVDKLQSQEDLRQLKIHRLQTQLDDIDRAAIQEGEDDRLTQEIAKNVNAEQVRESCSLVAYRFSGADGSVTDQLTSSFKELMKIAHVEPEFDQMLEMISKFNIELSELGRDLTRIAQATNSNPEELEMMQERLHLIEDLKRRHGGEKGDLASVLQAQNSLQVELELLLQESSRIALAKKEREELEQVLMAEALVLSAERQKAAITMAKLVESELGHLGMPHCRFQVQFVHRNDDGIVETVEDASPSSLRLNGLDAVEYLISPNPGEGFKSMINVASGGELSRILLALKVALIQTDPVGTYIFDEVDTGIGGGIAEAVGQKLQEIGNGRQVLCISHLPQVISSAHHHLQVQKQVVEGRTSSTVRYLGFSERVSEVARMLGGLTLTDKTLEHATEMLRSNAPSSSLQQLRLVSEEL